MGRTIFMSSIWHYTPLVFTIFIHIFMYIYRYCFTPIYSIIFLSCFRLDPFLMFLCHRYLCFSLKFFRIAMPPRNTRQTTIDASHACVGMRPFKGRSKKPRKSAPAYQKWKFSSHYDESPSEWPSTSAKSSSVTQEKFARLANSVNVNQTEARQAAPWLQQEPVSVPNCLRPWKA